MISTLYGYPIYIGKVAEYETIYNEIKAHLEKNAVYETDVWDASCLTTSNHGTSSNVNIFYSDNVIRIIEKYKTNMLTELGLPDIKTTCILCENNECNRCNDIWINIYRLGMKQGIHWHVGNNKRDPFLSFVYFAKYDPKNDAKLVFINPAPETSCKRMLTLDAYKRTTSIPLEEGDIIIFPSFMMHCVEEQKTDSLRITVAGNLYEKV